MEDDSYRSIISVSIEMLQIFESTKGLILPTDIVVFDVNDIIVNTAGGIAGWIIMKLFMRSKEREIQKAIAEKYI